MAQKWFLILMRSTEGYTISVETYVNLTPVSVLAKRNAGLVYSMKYFHNFRSEMKGLAHSVEDLHRYSRYNEESK